MQKYNYQHINCAVKHHGPRWCEARERHVGRQSAGSGLVSVTAAVSLIEWGSREPRASRASRASQDILSQPRGRETAVVPLLMQPHSPVLLLVAPEEGRRHVRYLDPAAEPK